MRLLSVNVGRPRAVEWRGQTVRTAIWKAPAHGRVRARPHNLEGDEQADLAAHGGRDKAVYAYPAEHYAYWGARLPGADLPPGAFGENFTLSGLLESDVLIGDVLCLGSAEFAVTQPRLPCHKLGLRFERPAMEKYFLLSLRTGFYLRVVQPGHVGAGDEITLGPRPMDSLTVLEIVDLFAAPAPDPKRLRRAAALTGLSPGLRAHFRRLLLRSGG